MTISDWPLLLVIISFYRGQCKSTYTFSAECQQLSAFRSPPPTCWLYAKCIISGKWKAEHYGNRIRSFTRTHFIAKSSSPKKLRKCARIFFWYNIMEPSMRHPDKKFILFVYLHKTSLVWGRDCVNHLYLHINWPRWFSAYLAHARRAKTQSFH